MKSAPGVNVQVPSPLSAKDPPSTVRPLATKPSPSTSLAFANNADCVINSVASSCTLKEAGMLISTSGASLTAATATDTVCVAVPPAPSETV